MYGFKKLSEAPEFSAGNTTSKPIPRGDTLSALLLVLSGTIAVAGGTGAGTVQVNPLHRLVRSVEIRAKAKSQIKVPGTTMRSFDRMGLGAAARGQTGESVALGAGASTAFELNLWIPLDMPFSFLRETFGLPTGVDGIDPEIAVSWGVGGDLVYGENATSITITGASTKLYAFPLRAAIPGRAMAPVQLLAQNVSVTTTEAKKRINIDNVPRGYEVRAVIVEAWKGGASGLDFVPANDVAGNMTLNVGGTDRVTELPWNVARQLNVSDYGWTSLDDGVAIIDAARTKHTAAGQLWLQAPDSAGNENKPYLDIDVTKQTGECLVVVTPICTPYVRNF